MTPKFTILPVTEPQSDDVLMARVQAGDRRAFAVLVGRHEAALRRVCVLIVRDDALARDIAQDTFIQLWRIKDSYKPEDKLKAFLFTVARNRCKSALRRRKVASLFLLKEKHEEKIVPDAAAASEARETQAAVNAALQRLPEKFRLPLALRFNDGLDYADIAKIIGRTESAARSRVHYALKELHGALPKELLYDL